MLTVAPSEGKIDQGVERWNRVEWCFALALKLLKSLWTVGCLDVSSAWPATARCCSEIKPPRFLEEPRSSHVCSHKALISPYSALTLFLSLYFSAL